MEFENHLVCCSYKSRFVYAGKRANETLQINFTLVRRPMNHSRMNFNRSYPFYCFRRLLFLYRFPFVRCTERFDSFVRYTFVLIQRDLLSSADHCYTTKSWYNERSELLIHESRKDSLKALSSGARQSCLFFRNQANAHLFVPPANRAAIVAFHSNL